MGEGETPDTEWVTAMATIEPTERTAFPAAPFTVDDLFNFPDDGNRYELFNGSLVVSPAPTPCTRTRSSGCRCFSTRRCRRI